MTDPKLMDTGNQVAVIGMAGRFPGARGIDEFWRNLRDGRESTSFFNEEELRAAGVDPAEARRPDYVNARGLLEGIDLFDAEFFGFSPREAEIMDPQQRIFLECAWHALEDAGYDGPGHPAPIGLYAACGMNNYLLTHLLRNQAAIASVGISQIRISNRLDNLATRTSYKLNLRGPSINVQTGCSSSLVAIHLACQSLLSGESEMALAGGVRVNILSRHGYVYEEGSVLSPDGHTRAFDARARGTIVGDGVGVVVLKRLEDALGDGDSIRAVILGSAVNNDGSRKIGYTAPSVEGQAKAISEAQAMAGVEADTITYVEAHGTGTPLGDPIEVAALTQAFRASTSRRGFCALGSVKTNFGHLDTASGVAGLIKTVLALENRSIPPSLNFEQPNPAIDFAASPFYVNTRLADWPAGEAPRRAGVSSFGIGGTNAHVVLEEAPFVEPSGLGFARPWQLLVLSARSPEALETATGALADFVRRHPDLPVADVAFTLQAGRRRFDCRRSLVVRSLEEAAEILDSKDPERTATAFEPPRERPVAFLFPGQGVQRPDTASGLYRDEPVFREEVDRCIEMIAPHLEFDLLRALFPGGDPDGTAARFLAETEVAQPAIFVLEYALARLWMSWGVRPESMAGHSLGEYVAACLAGVMSLEDALALVTARGRLMQRLAPGAMLAVFQPAERLRSCLGEDLSLAAVNSPSMCVVSGPVEPIEALRERLAGEGLDARRLHTARAFHSAMVEPVLTQYAELVRGVALKPPRIPFLSNVTGTWITDAQATDPGYWAEHLRRTVLFADNLAELLREPDRILLEVGPGRTLCTFVHQATGPDAAQLAVASLPNPGEGESGLPQVLSALGKLWCAGVAVEWAGLHTAERRCRLALPGYPFERQRHWVEPVAQGGRAGRQGEIRKRSDIADWFQVPSWKRLAPLDVEGAGDAERRDWLVFAGEGELDAELVARLRGGGARVTTVRVGERLERLTSHDWSLDPAVAAQYSELLDALAGEEPLPDRIVHLWGLTIPKNRRGTERFEECQRLGFHSVVSLARALSDLGSSRPCEIVVVADGLHEVVGGEDLNPEKATVLGACLVIPQEHPNLSCRVLDLAFPAPMAPLTAQILAEILAEAAPPVVALRGGARWGQAFEPVRLPERAGAPVRLRRQGVYLILGGLGRIGLALAERLAQEQGARLVLASRTSLPAREEWDHWIATDGPDGETAARLRRLRGIEEAGGAVLTVTVDVADEESLRSAFARASERFGEVHGVIHAAGATRSFCAVREMNETAASLHFQPKAFGCLALESALRGQQLDFVLLLSSLSAVLGGLGYAAHSAAHQFLDAFALRQTRTGPLPWLSLDLDGWRFGQEEHRQRAAAGLAQLALAPEEGVEAIFRFLNQTAATWMVLSTGDLEARMTRRPTPSATHAQEAAEGSEPASQPRRFSLRNAYVAPASETERLIAEIWQALLGIERVGATDDFFDLGGHSLLGVQLVSRLRESFQVETPMRRVFEETTVRGLAKVVEEILLREIEQLSDEEAERLLGEAS